MLADSAPSGMPVSADSDGAAVCAMPISNRPIAHPVMSRDLPTTRPPGPLRRQKYRFRAGLRPKFDPLTPSRASCAARLYEKERPPCSLGGAVLVAVYERA